MHATAARTTLDPETTDTAAISGALSTEPAGEEHRTPPRTPHRWVGAALVDLGLGAAGRAEHAVRTGRHTLRADTRIEVLEVYCTSCRVAYSERACYEPCRTVVARAG